MPVNPIPAGYSSITPYLTLHDATGAIEFYKKAFNATEKFRFSGPAGKVGHAELSIGDSVIMLADEFPERGTKSPKTLGGSPVGIHLYLPDVDKAIEQAVASGGKLTCPIQNHFYGDRSGSVEDPFGYTWHLSTHIEDVSPEEMQARAKKACEQKGD